MFHLLVSYNGWPESRGSIRTERIYIYPNVPVSSEFIGKDKVLNVDKIKSIPALLVTETLGNGPQFARVAYINNVTSNGRDTSIEYIIDSKIEPISNDDLEKFSSELNLGGWGLNHTCWQIIDSDLFEILLINHQRKSIKPSVFSIKPNQSVQKDLVAVMMPFSSELDKVYSRLKKIVSSLNLSIKRADNLWENHAVMQDVVDLIVRARVVICDCTGRNPNVFYEIGIAHTLGKEVILITQNKEDIPFDLQHLRHIEYSLDRRGLGELDSKIKERINFCLE